MGWRGVKILKNGMDIPLLVLPCHAQGFTGMVASDCNAIQEISDTHNFTDTVTQAVGAALVAGVDLDCSGYVLVHV